MTFEELQCFISVCDVDEQTSVQMSGMKNFSFHAFTLYYAACLRKKYVSSLLTGG